jgi:FlaA1/EpsC-like NDP-sugar epimerase
MGLRRETLKPREQAGQLERVRNAQLGRSIRAALTDALIIFVALVLAVGLANDFRYQVGDRTFLTTAAPLLILAGLSLLLVKGLYRVHSRYAGLSDLFGLMQVSALLTLLYLLLMLSGRHLLQRDFRLAEPVLFGGFAMGFLAFSRVGRRLYDWLPRQPEAWAGTNATP